jgi:hypothetical protein
LADAKENMVELGVLQQTWIIHFNCRNKGGSRKWGQCALRQQSNLIMIAFEEKATMFGKTLHRC